MQWLTAVANGKFQCSYCRAFVAKKDIYPRWDDLGPDFQAWWTAHEATAASEAPAGAPASTTAHANPPAAVGFTATPDQQPASATDDAPGVKREPGTT